MRIIVAGTAVALVACGTASQTHKAPSTAQVQPAQPTATAEAPAGPAPSAPPGASAASEVAAAPDNGLNDLAAMTFDCPKAALNAAAREAAQAPSQGTYQFAYFGIVSDSHHAAYEVHFKSNYQDEKPLKYCVSIYCQQGWDPQTTKAAVTLIPEGKQPTVAKGAHEHCSGKDKHVGALRTVQ